jgi:CRP-like cAMP-binding protein
MNLRRNVDWLRDLPLFQFFNEEQLQLMAFNCRDRNFEDGQILFETGDRALSAFVVVSGAVELIGDNGKKLYGDSPFGPGTVIGEAAMIVLSKRPAIARAVGDVQAMEIPRSVFLRLLEEYPEVAEKIRLVMAERLADFVADLSSVKLDATEETS